MKLERFKDNQTVLGYGLVNEPYINTNNEANYNLLDHRDLHTIVEEMLTS